MRRPVAAAAAALLLVVQSASLALAQVGSAVAQQPATILRLSGNVFVRPAGEASFRRAHERERLAPGSAIRTGAGAEVILQLSERNLVRIGEETDFTIDEASVSTEALARQGGLLSGRRRNVHHFRMGIENGEALSVLRGLRGNSSFEMRTPVATAGVRGTIFSTEVTRARAAGATKSKRPATKQAGGQGQGQGGQSENANQGTGNSPSEVASENSNVGEGNQGQGVGNTGPGNQGQGPNAGTAGNAGGGGGDVTTNFTCYEGSLDVSGQGIDGTVNVPAGYSMTVTGTEGGGAGGDLGAGGAGAGPGGAAGGEGEAEGAAAEGGEGEAAGSGAAEGGEAGAVEGAPTGDEGGAAPAPGLEPIGGDGGGIEGGGGALPPTVTSVTVVLAPITSTDAAVTGVLPPPPDVSAMVALPGGSLAVGIGGGSGLCPE